MQYFLFLIGACVGSFINAYVYRVAVKYKLRRVTTRVSRTIKSKRSFCDFCGKKLHWYDNVPVISWFVLGGKSRCCRKKLPVLYPLTEITTAVLFLNLQFTIYNLQTTMLLLVSMAIVGFLVFSTVFDLKYMILPDFSTFILIGLAFLYKIIGGVNWLQIASDILIGLSFFSFFYFLHVQTGGKGMGFGDVKLAFLMGFLLGWPKIVVGLYVAFVMGALVGLTMIILAKKSRKSLIPFGPFMILGMILAWWYGDIIWQYALKVL